MVQLEVIKLHREETIGQRKMVVLVVVVEGAGLLVVAADIEALDQLVGGMQRPVVVVADHTTLVLTNLTLQVQGMATVK